MHFIAKHNISSEGTAKPRQHFRSSVGFQSRSDLHRYEKVAGEKIGIQVSKRRRVAQLGGRNHSVGLAPLPIAVGKVLQPFPQIRGGHRVSVDADVLCKQTCEGFQKPSFQVAVNVPKCRERPATKRTGACV